MPRYDFKCEICHGQSEVMRRFDDPDWNVAPMCCSIPMKRDYTNDNAGFIPTAGMYSRDSR